MTPDQTPLEQAKSKALDAAYLYNTGQINLAEAKIMMEDYRQLFNVKAAEIAAKYGQKPQKFSAKMFIRYGR